MHPPVVPHLAPRRDLPWRRTRDPWAVLVSELMLQQTQVARVLAPYARFLDRFPSVAACAQAPVAAVVELWSGLGYNRRAVNLHRTAVAVVERHDGRLPTDIDSLLALPGIGPYTARAVAVYAFEQPVCPLDVNTSRPLARAFGIREQVRADSLVPADAAWEWAQGLMDLGAVVCTRREPRCGSCPWSAVCGWHRAGHPEPDPAVPAARHSRFEGSDRQGRGRLVERLRRGPVDRGGLAAACGWPDDVLRAEAVAASLVRDGLAAWSGDVLALPA